MYELIRKYLSYLLIFCSLEASGQEKAPPLPDSITVTSEQLHQTLKLMKDLNTKGLDIVKDSLVLSDEFYKLLHDDLYFKTIYPDKYTWEETIRFIGSKDLKKAFWYMINLYPESEKNKKLVTQSVLAYDAALKMDRVLINVFYSYAFTDPESSTIEDHSPEINRPEVLESKLSTVDELIKVIFSYRELQEK